MGPVSCEEEAALQAEADNGGLEMAGETHGKWWIVLQDGAPKIAKLPYKWLYGRYNYS